MNIEELRDYCISKKGASESFPFANSILVFKVIDKMFALTSLDGEFTVNLKCDPDLAKELRVEFPSVIPGYHMNKKHWNTIIIDGTIKDSLVYQWIDDSYDLIVNSLSLKD